MTQEPPTPTCVALGCTESEDIAGFAKVVDGEMQAIWLCDAHAPAYEANGWRVIK